MPPPGARQTMLFSATFPIEIQRLASDFLSNYIFLAIGRVGSSDDLIVQKVEFIQNMDKRNYLMNLLCAQRADGNHGKHALALVFVETKRGADALEQWLSMNGFPATAIHGDKVQVDIDDYVHRIGWTGRAGKSGFAKAFFSDKNLPLAKALVELMQEAKQEVPPWLSQYAEASYGAGTRAHRYGGHDFRSFSGGNNHYSIPYTDVVAVGEEPYCNASNADIYSADSRGYSFDHGSFDCGGWE